MIICSPVNSPTTNRIIIQYKHYQLTKILLIDIIGNIFNYENRLYENFNASEQNDLLVLTIMTHRFRHILYSRFHVEFSRYLSMRGAHEKHHLTNESDCDIKKLNGSHYNEIVKDFTSCQEEIRERCNNYSIEDIRSFCTNITETTRNMKGKETLTRGTNNAQLVFSEHFNLFDFIMSLGEEGKNANNQDRRQFDFIVLEFKSMVTSSNDSIEFWRPLLILEQSKIDRYMFTMHRALSERDVFEEWVPPKLWKCNSVCWSIFASILFILVSLVFLISVSAGFAAR